MFTGITSDLGRVRSIAGDSDVRIILETGYDTGPIAEGASVACSGVCLSVVAKGTDWLGFDASAETLQRTTLGGWRAGTRVNLEQALRVGDELGGHFVLGHVDSVAVISERASVGESERFLISTPESFARFVAEKGSVTLDGVSLTVNKVRGAVFEVNVIPHTLRVTTFGRARENDLVNLEVDVIARYLARFTEAV